MKMLGKNIITVLLIALSIVFPNEYKVYAEDVQRSFKTVVASSNHGSYPPQYAIDGITTTRWQHQGSDNVPTMTFDFGRRTSFNKLVLLPTSASTVDEFKIEAADNKEMTKNRVLIARGTDLSDESVFSFKRISRRYVRYTVTKKNGVVGLLEFSAFQSEPYEIEMTDEQGEITIPSQGEEEKVNFLPQVIVKDTSGHTVHSSNYTLTYTAQEISGVEVSNDGKITVTPDAQAQEFNVRIAVSSNSDIFMDVPIKLISKENLLVQKNVMGESGVANLNDGRFDTCYEPAEEAAEIIFDLGENTEINKIVLASENYEQSGNIRISASQNEDFSEEITLFETDILQSDKTIIRTQRNTVRYIKLNVESQTGVRLREMEVYSVYPHKIVLDTRYNEVYIPTFDEGEAVKIPAAEAKIVDIYGDELHGELSSVIWTTPLELPQGITLDATTGELGIDPITSETELDILVSSSHIQTVNNTVRVKLTDKIAQLNLNGNIAYSKTVESSPAHGSYPPENAVDATTGTRLQFISSTQNPYLIVDFGEETEFNSATTRILDASGVIKLTVRAAQTREALFEEESIVAEKERPFANTTTVVFKSVNMRYIMLCFEEIEKTVAITEFEVRKIDPAIIYMPNLPEIIQIPEEGEITTEDAGIEIRDKFGSILSIDADDYVISSSNLPVGVSLDTLTGAVTVTSSAPVCAFDIRITSTEDETVYNNFTVVLSKGGSGDDGVSEILLSQEMKKFNITDYVSSAVADADFTLPISADNAVTVSYAENSDALEIDTLGNVKVNRGNADEDVSVNVIFELDGKTLQKTVVIKVPAMETTQEEVGGYSPGGGGGISSTAPLVKEEKNEEEPEKEETDEKLSAFSDIGEALWAEKYLTELVKLKIMNGNNGKLRPNDNITREEFVKMIVCAFLPNAEKLPIIGFEDIQEDSWCYGYISAATNSGIINGISNDLFGAGRSITRQDAAVIAKRAANVANLELKEEDEVLLVDAEDISDYAKEAVLSLGRAGIISGNTSNYFLPNNPITRAEAAKIICLLLSEKEEYYE